MKSARIWSFSGPYFPTFGVNKEIYSVSFRIQSEYGKIRIRKIPNTDTFYALVIVFKLVKLCLFKVLCKKNYLGWRFEKAIAIIEINILKFTKLQFFL